jgi:hypothetical protein
LSHLVNLVHPLRKPLYAVPHAVLIAVVVLAAFLAGAFTGSRFTASYYAHRYSAPLHEPAGMRPAPALAPHAAVAASLISRYIPKPMDQGPEGSCCGQSVALGLDYAVRSSSPHHRGIRYSPGCLYSAYALQYNNGQDLGSWPTQIGQIITAQGAPQYLTCPEPPYGIAAWTPAQQTSAAKWRLLVTVNDLASGNGGQGITDALQEAIDSGHVALVALNVTPSFDAATQTNGLVWDHGPESSRGGHCVGFIAVNPGMVFPNGDIGGAEVQNSWGPYFGVKGRAWISFAWLQRNAWAVQTLTLG